MPLAQFAQSGRADLLAHFDQNLAIEAERTAFREHRLKASDIDRVLALVVRCAPTVDAVAFDNHPPRRQSRPPHIVKTTNGVPMSVHQNRNERRIFDALGSKYRGPERIVENATGKSESRQRRHNLVVEITAKLD